MSPSPPVLDRVSTRLNRLSMRAEAFRLRLTPRSTLTQRVEAESGDPGDWSFLRRPALLGFIAVVSICVGASLPSSPFKLEMGGTWFFGEANWPTTTLMLPGVVAVYGGMVLFVRVWFGLYQTLRARPGMSIRPLVYMLVLWLLPLLAVAPLFSRDVFSYAAQGEMMSHGINPYHYGPGILGSAGPYTSGVDPLWANTAAPYGPLFLMLAGWSASLSLHHALVTVVLLRLQSVVGIALIAYCIPKLARSFGHDAGPAFVLAVLNPLTLLALVGGAHNDAIMVGSLLAGVTAARSRHLVWGVVLCRAGSLHKGACRHRHRLRGVGLGRCSSGLAPPRPHGAALRPPDRGGHGGTLPRIRSWVGVARQSGDAGHRALVDGPGHWLRSVGERIGPCPRDRGRPGRCTHADPGHRVCWPPPPSRCTASSTANASGC